MRYSTSNGMSYFAVNMSEQRRARRRRKIYCWLAKHRILFPLIVLVALITFPFVRRKEIGIIAAIALPAIATTTV